MDGMVSLRTVNVGDFVGEMGAKLMFRIVDNRVLDLTVTVPSGEMAALRPGQLITFSTDAFPGRTFSGKVMFINPIVNEADRSIRVVAEVDNRNEQLKSGLFVTGIINTGERKGVLDSADGPADLGCVRRKRGGFHYSAARRLPGPGARQAVSHGGSFRRPGRGDATASIWNGAPGIFVITRGGFNVKDGDKVNVLTRTNGEK